MKNNKAFFIFPKSSCLSDMTGVWDWKIRLIIKSCSIQQRVTKQLNVETILYLLVLLIFQ